MHVIGAGFGTVQNSQNTAVNLTTVQPKDANSKLTTSTSLTAMPGWNQM